MHLPPSTPCEPIEGEAIRLSRWHPAKAGFAFLVAVLVGAGGAFLIVLALELPPDDVWFTAAFGVLGLLIAGYFASSGWHLLTHSPCLVLGQDRLQFRSGKHVSWEVRYSDIADVALFAPVHPLGFSMPWTSCLGIRLTNPDRAACCRRQCGFHVAIPVMGSCEPAERCLEAVLRCYQAFKADEQELR